MLLIIQLLVFLGFPFVVAFLRRNRIKLSPIVASYIVGIALGNLFPGFLDNEVSMTLTEGAVLLSIPLLLFGTDLKAALKEGKTMALSFAIASVSTLVGVVTAFYNTGTIALKSTIAGMITGVYTGGTTNLNAVGMALDAPGELFVVLNAFDTVYSGIYLLLILSVLKPALSSFMPVSDHHDPAWNSEAPEKTSLKDIGLTHVFAMLLIAAAVGITFALKQKLDATLIIVLLSGFALLASRLKRVSALKQPHIQADFWLQVFAIAMGSMARIDSIDFSDLVIPAFLGMVFISMLLLHYALNKIIKSDADTAIIASTAAVFGPPFVGLVATKLKAEKLILPGIAMAILGNAFGTYLGLVIHWML
jgi:uncharacterized membrane protein